MSDAAPSSPLSALLGNLGQHAAVLKELGYDEVADFDKVGNEELAVLKSTLIERGVPAGHVGRLERLFLSKRPQPKVEPPPPPITPPVPPPQEPPPQASGETHTPAAEAVAAAAAEPLDDLKPVDLTQWPKVKEFLDNANGRTIFGCGPTKASVVLSPHEVAMNQAAVDLLRAKPQLLGWEGRLPKKGDLITACRDGHRGRDGHGGCDGRGRHRRRRGGRCRDGGRTYDRRRSRGRGSGGDDGTGHARVRAVRAAHRNRRGGRAAPSARGLWLQVRRWRSLWRAEAKAQ